jgi:hypothetical protein
LEGEADQMKCNVVSIVLDVRRSLTIIVIFLACWRFRIAEGSAATATDSPRNTGTSGSRIAVPHTLLTIQTPASRHSR